MKDKLERRLHDIVGRSDVHLDNYEEKRMRALARAVLKYKDALHYAEQEEDRDYDSFDIGMELATAFGIEGEWWKP